MHSNGRDCFPNFWPLFLSLITFWQNAIFIDYFMPTVQLLNQKGIFPLGSTQAGFAWKMSCPWWPGKRNIGILGGSCWGDSGFVLVPHSLIQPYPRQSHAVGVILGWNLLRTQGNEEGRLIFGRDWRGGSGWAVPCPLSVFHHHSRAGRGGSPSHRAFVLTNRYTMQFIFKILSIKTVLITDSRSIRCNYSRL